ncbi:hypothetical protein Egran_02682 [Elaphomyces granulatus]|uniref:Zn(2)-C6 fungal-type domain-containing protein n=1 Tax=Elaphomyces granulatus TaxID=519963 RepID=A0A232LZN0_9EURO|nr:hypothetical protein Egran_02682 [Elaphomyces granulatus]
MASTPRAPPVVIRPYRSHKMRACDLCRKRKSRCTVDIPGQSCLLCRVQGADCHYQEESNIPEAQAVEASVNAFSETHPILGHGQRKRRKPIETASASLTAADAVGSPSEKGPVSRRGSVGKPPNRKFEDSGQNESVLIVGPVAAEDAQVIEKFMPPEKSSRSVDTSKKPYNVYSNDPRKPILYTTVSRWRQGVRVSSPPGENQKEILEQILGPFRHDIVKLFLDKFNTAFPLFDGEAFWQSYVSDSRDDPPTSLLCQIYAMALVYWKQTPKLAAHPKPDVRYAVNLTVAALHEEFSAPGLSTLSAALVDLTGRPVFSMTGNAINCGRTVSLAHCLGLNRDPTNWKISSQEKNQRIRLWWGVVIHDRWGSLGHGVPPQIAKIQYDVPLPSVDILVTLSSPTSQHIKAAHCHIALCKLTEILGELLLLVYRLQPKSPRETTDRLRHIRTDLDLWERALPEWLKFPWPASEPSLGGVCSLHLGFLAVKLLVCRVELHQEANYSDSDNPETRGYFQTECRKAAEEIIQFISSLQNVHFREFWLPYSAFHLTSTATLLVRCALETTDQEIARSCLANVEALISVLRRIREEEDWDPADMCLDYCERILSRHPGNNSNLGGGSGNTDESFLGGTAAVVAAATPGQNSIAAMGLPDTLTHNDIVDDMMSISGMFGTVDGFPFDMTGIWDISGFQDFTPT